MRTVPRSADPSSTTARSTSKLDVLELVDGLRRGDPAHVGHPLLGRTCRHERSQRQGATTAVAPTCSRVTDRGDRQIVSAPRACRRGRGRWQHRFGERRGAESRNRVAATATSGRRSGAARGPCPSSASRTRVRRPAPPARCPASRPGPAREPSPRWTRGGTACDRSGTRRRPDRASTDRSAVVAGRPSTCSGLM